MPALARAAGATTPCCPGWFLGPVLPTYIARTQNGAPPQFGTSFSGGEFLAIISICVRNWELKSWGSLGFKTLIFGY